MDFDSSSTMEQAKPDPKHRKGLWSPDEDERLRNYILRHGHGCWTTVAINSGLQRNGKSCRLRWINYLRPGLKRGTLSAHEEETIMNLHRTLGNKWSQIARHLPGRTDNEIKNFWHSYLKKRAAKRSEDIESISKIKFSKSNHKDETELLPVRSSSATILSFDILEQKEVFSMHNQSSAMASSILNNQLLPKLLFAEWLTTNDNNKSHSQINNYHQATSNQFPCDNNCKDIDLITTCNNLDSFQDGVTDDQGVTYEEGSCNSNELYDGMGNVVVFDSQLKFEEQTPDYDCGFDDLLYGDEIIPHDLFISYQ